MKLYGGPLGVHVPQGRQGPGRSVIRYRPEGCPMAYCKIEVTDVPQLMGLKVGRYNQLDAGHVHKSEGVDWLHTHNALRWLQCGKHISGPAGHTNRWIEFIPALVCSDAHPDIGRNYLHRPRHGWPSPQQLEVIEQFPLLLVLTGHKLSHTDEIPLQARFSWSQSEMALIMELPDYIKQVYIAVKCAYKQLMECFHRSNRPVQGRSTVGSYYLKTTLYIYWREDPPQWSGHNSISCVTYFMISMVTSRLASSHITSCQTVIFWRLWDLRNATSHVM